MTTNTLNEKPLKLIPKDRILADILTLAIILTVMGAICVFIAPGFTVNKVINSITDTQPRAANVPVMNDSSIITFEPRMIGYCSPESMKLMNNLVDNDIGDKSDGHKFSGIFIALIMCEYIQMNYEYDTGIVCLWNSPTGCIDHAQVWVEINGEKYIIETLFNDKDNRIYNVSEHKRIWDERYKIQFTTLEKGYEHNKKYTEGGIDREPRYRLWDIANEDNPQPNLCGTNYDGVSGFVPD